MARNLTRFWEQNMKGPVKSRQMFWSAPPAVSRAFIYAFPLPFPCPLTTFP